ncbi:MAG TPA: hypothetical protein PKV67_10055 [Hyphomonas sp.]|nr:hypothetical protein [Hyphomonas sp.]HRK67648.1 hypothetical protein [Hyphomonas sp.]
MKGRNRHPDAPTLCSSDIVAGIGIAPRSFLATSIALFEDSILQKRVADLIGKLDQGNVAAQSSPDSDDTAVASLQKTAAGLSSSKLSDDELRLILWIKVREALQLPALTFGSLRSSKYAADDLVAASMGTLKPNAVDVVKSKLGLGSKEHVPSNLDELARRTLAELIESVFEVKHPATKPIRDEMLRSIKCEIESLTPEVQAELMKSIGAQDLNDDAIRKILITGGGLGSLGVGVSLGGFSAYILTAQASAFIPFVSGPALVSLVAVLSNPITIILTTLGVGALLTKNVNDKIATAIALRVLSLLALTGVSAGEKGHRKMIRIFALLRDKSVLRGVPDSCLKRYQSDWRIISPIHESPNELSVQTAEVMDRAISADRGLDRWARVLEPGRGQASSVTGRASFSLGELLYTLHAIDPGVLQMLSDVSDLEAFALDSSARRSPWQTSVQIEPELFVSHSVVASLLIEQGHLIELPGHGVQADWHIKVDGEPFRILNVSNLYEVERQLALGLPHPILANAEIAALMASKDPLPEWASQVHFVEGYSKKLVNDTKEQMLAASDHASDTHNLDFIVPLSAIRHVIRYGQGEISGRQAIQEILIDGTVQTGLAVAGKFAGGTIGLLVFGPAGGLVFAGVLPMLSRSQLGPAKNILERATQGNQYKEWNGHALESFKRLVDRLQKALIRKAEKLKARQFASRNKVVSEYLCWRQEDALRFLRERHKRLKSLDDLAPGKIEEASAHLLSWLSTSTLHPKIYQLPLAEWTVMMSKRPDLGDNLTEAVDRGRRLMERLWNSRKT